MNSEEAKTVQEIKKKDQIIRKEKKKNPLTKIGVNKNEY